MMILTKYDYCNKKEKTAVTGQALEKPKSRLREIETANLCCNL